MDALSLSLSFQMVPCQPLNLLPVLTKQNNPYIYIHTLMQWKINRKSLILCSLQCFTPLEVIANSVKGCLHPSLLGVTAMFFPSLEGLRPRRKSWRASWIPTNNVTSMTEFTKKKVATVIDYRCLSLKIFFLYVTKLYLLTIKWLRNNVLANYLLIIYVNLT